MWITYEVGKGRARATHIILDSEKDRHELSHRCLCSPEVETIDTDPGVVDVIVTHSSLDS